MNIYEKVRPKSFSEVLGQDKAVSRIQAVIARGWGGRAWWISGASGVGKTTLAKLIAAAGADAWSTEEIQAGELNPSKVREIEGKMHLSALGTLSGRAFIVNEAHGMRKDAIRAWLDVLERLPAHAIVIFTTTRDGQESLFEDDPTGDAGPLLSRCIPVELTNQGLAKVFAERALQIAQAEGLDGQPIEKYIRLVQDCKNNFRAVLTRIESGCMMK